METSKRTTERKLTQALELYEKGISLSSIQRTYPELKNEIDELFSGMAILSTHKGVIEVPVEGLERLLASLPEQMPIVETKLPVQSPLSIFWSSMHLSNWKYLVPIAALAILTGGLIVSRHAGVPVLPSTLLPSEGTGPTQVATTAKPSATATTTPGSAPLAALSTSPSSTDRLIASFSQETARESGIASQENSQKTLALGDTSLMKDPTANYGK